MEMVLVPWIMCGGSENMKGSTIAEESIFWEPLFCLTSVETDMLAFVWLRGERANRTERDVTWGESLAGQPAPAKQRIYCHGKVSSPQSVWHTYPLWHTDIADSSEPLKLLPKPLSSACQLSTPPSFLPSQTKVSARQTDNQTGAQSMHKISTHTRRQTCMMCRRHLPRQPNNEPTLTLTAILFICWQARKRRPTMLSLSSFPLIFSAPCINISALEHASLFPLSGFRIIYLSRLPTKANNWDSISVITINRSSSQCILLWL